jgi:hypothetical protein
MNRLLARLVVALAAAIAPPALAAPNLAGTVDFVEGDATIVKPDKSRKAPAVGDKVYEGDSVVTGAGGEVHFNMEDGGFLAVRPGTKMRIAQFQATGESTDKSVLGLLEGTLRSISGWIAQSNPKGYQIRASSATIGIRGTDHETHVRLKGDAEGEAGVYDRVTEGATFIRTDQGTAEVSPGKAGFWSPKARGRPRVLDRPPAFFRPTRNEGRVNGRHAKIQPQLRKKLEERRALGKAHAKEKAGKPRKEP